MKTVSLELSKALKEAGYPQFESDRAWHEVDDLVRFNSEDGKDKVVDGWILNIHAYNFSISKGRCDSPTADEILEQLPIGFNIGQDKEGAYCLSPRAYHAGDIFEYGETLADAAAKCWLYLKKEGLI